MCTDHCRVSCGVACRVVESFLSLSLTGVSVRDVYGLWRFPECARGKAFTRQTPNPPLSSASLREGLFIVSGRPENCKTTSVLATSLLTLPAAPTAAAARSTQGDNRDIQYGLSASNKVRDVATLSTSTLSLSAPERGRAAERTSASLTAAAV